MAHGAKVCSVREPHHQSGAITGINYSDKIHHSSGATNADMQILHSLPLTQDNFVIAEHD